MNRQKAAGLIGYPLSHSFSKGYFTDKFHKEGLKGWKYSNFELDEVSMIIGVIGSNPELLGLNVTIPYKEAIIPYLDELSVEAEEIGAVNTICIERYDKGTKLTGHNTDHIGFGRLLDLILKEKPKGALILGTGGASKAVKYVLQKRDIEYISVSRSPGANALNYKDINQSHLQNFKLIINTTPLGMFPDVELKPELPFHYLRPDNYLVDLIYNPDKTLFLELGEQAGAQTINGLPMLISQAEASWELWTNQGLRLEAQGLRISMRLGYKAK